MRSSGAAATVAALKVVLLAGAAACAGVSHSLDPSQPVPKSIAVLPFAGSADQLARDCARSLFETRLAARGYAVAESAWVDRRLSELGDLRDPSDYMSDAERIGEVRRALDVDAVLVGSAIDESSFQWVVLRRHSFGGELALRGDASRPWWRASHRAGGFGGLVLRSGQIFTELRAQSAHGTPMATLALIDEFVEDVVDTLPPAPADERIGDAPFVRDVRLQRADPDADRTRVTVSATASPRASLRFDLGPGHIGVPMVEDPGRPGAFVGACDFAAGDVGATVTVRARDAFGRVATAEGAR
ncbi:MAG: hypothetical protein KDE27_09695 [Planctomycetes bacterium]|nr:hypothetical protein [Planctomycetota bacterium]